MVYRNKVTKASLTEKKLKKGITELAREMRKRNQLVRGIPENVN